MTRTFVPVLILMALLGCATTHHRERLQTVYQGQKTLVNCDNLQGVVIDVGVIIKNSTAKRETDLQIRNQLIQTLWRLDQFGAENRCPVSSIAYLFALSQWGDWEKMVLEENRQKWEREHPTSKPGTKGDFSLLP